jgi:cystathionine beta-lyase
VWRFDAEQLRAQMVASNARALMLCSPHNPVGRLWSREELLALGSLAEELDLQVIADEIHSDLVFDGVFIGFAALSDSLRARTITITSANKAYNLAALKVAMVVFGTAAQEARLLTRITKRMVGAVSTAGVLANFAAYREGGPWLDAAVEYLRENRLLFARTLRELAPEITVTVPEATYLSWLDFSAVPGVVGGGEVALRLVDEARVGLNEGTTFGAGLSAFARANLATSRSLVVELATRIGTWAAAQR